MPVPSSRILIALACLLAGCGPALTVAAVRAPGAIAADPQKATIVIIQPESRLRTVNLVDGHGRFVGQLDDRSHTVVRVDEGPTLLYAVAGNDAQSADRLEGTLIAGRLYYATVSARGSGLALRALTPRSPDDRWARRSAYVAGTPRVQLDPEKVGRAVNDLGNVVPLMEAADDRVLKLDPAEQAERQFQESDGL